MNLPKKADGTIDKRYLRGVARKTFRSISKASRNKSKVPRNKSKTSRNKSPKVVHKYFNKKTGKYLKRMHALKGKHKVTGSGFDLTNGVRDIFYDEE